MVPHANGHQSRLERKEVNEPLSFRSDPYNRGENWLQKLEAALLRGQCDIENATIDRSASYINGWLKRLKDDQKSVVTAGAQAQKACDFILDIKHIESDPPTEAQPKE